eukprot:gene46171-57571_t
MIAEHAIVADLERGDAGAVAIASFERGDRFAPIARGFAQRVERMVITLGDIATLRRIDRRGFGERAAEFVDQRAVAVEGGEQAREQGWQVGAARETFAQEP